MNNSLNLISNKTTNYNDVKYNGKPVCFSEYIVDKYNVIHKQLYQNALNKYIAEQENPVMYKNIHKFIEIKNTEYYKPSKVFIIDKTNKYHKKEIVDLSRYWNTYQETQLSKNISYIYLDPESVADAKIVYIDYVNGRTKLKSKFTENEFWVENKFITDDIELSDELISKNTFTELNTKNNKI